MRAAIVMENTPVPGPWREGRYRGSGVNYAHAREITSLRIDTGINGRRNRDGLRKGVLQEFCTVESITYDPVVDGGQRPRHRFCVLSVGSNLSNNRRCRGNGDARQLTSDNNKRPVGPQSFGELP